MLWEKRERGAGVGNRLAQVVVLSTLSRTHWKARLEQRQKGSEGVHQEGIWASPREKHSQQTEQDHRLCSENRPVMFKGQHGVQVGWSEEDGR